MKTHHLLYLAPLSLLFLFSCKSNPVNFEGGNPGIANMKMADASVPPPSPPSALSQDENRSEPASAPIVFNTTSITRKIIKDGRMEIRVKELEQGKKEADSLVKKFKGYYADETFNNMDYAHGYSLKIRIPSASFDAFIAELELGAGEVAFKNIASRDVTEEFIDLETRMNSKKNYLNRYGDLLKQATSVNDILEIEEKTRLIEEEMESVQGRLKYLNNQVDYSTLDLQLSKKNDYNAYSNNKGQFYRQAKNVAGKRVVRTGKFHPVCHSDMAVLDHCRGIILCCQHCYKKKKEEEIAVSGQRSAVSSQRLAISVQRSAVSVSRSALAISIQRSCSN